MWFGVFTIIVFSLFIYSSQSFSFYSKPASRGKHGMVVSAHHLATEVGVEILKRGGNAVDAAVAVGFALAVVFPEAGNIGGGGYMLIREHDGNAVVIDFREKAPKAATKNMYLDSAGNVTTKSLVGHLASGVPGTVAGLLNALEKFGTMDRTHILQPAIDIAERGVVVDERLAKTLEAYREELLVFSSTKEIYTRNDSVLKEGDTLRNPDLVRTLRRIQEEGNDGFYEGETAQLIIEEMQRGGGIISLEDLAVYKPLLRKPLSIAYRGYEILSTPPSSSGGICLSQLLNIVEAYNLSAMGYHSSKAVHVMTEAMKRVYADRAEYLGDPDFMDVGIERMISKEYAAQRRSEIDTNASTPSFHVRAGEITLQEQEHTTHYVVADQWGNIVSTTYTINDLFGNKVIVKGAGFFLNNEMDDFAVKAGTPNVYGLTGGDANAIAPEKRPLSSMTPTIVVKDGKPVIALGARGGSKIITAIFQTLVNVIDFGMDVQQAVDAPRFHHQWLPDELLVEKYCLPKDVVENLKRMGHEIKEVEYAFAALEVLWYDAATGYYYGAPDHREGGVALGY